MDPRHLERLVARERRQDRRQPPGEHRLARPRRAAEQQVVAAGRGDRQRLDRARRARGRRRGRAAARDGAGIAARPAAGAPRRAAPPATREVRDPEHLHAAGEPRLGGALERHDEPAQPAPARTLGGDERPRAGADLAAERQLAEDREALERGGGIVPCGGEDRAGDRQVEARAGLAQRAPGARLTVIRRWGNSKPALRIAALTRSRDSVDRAVGEARRP